MREKFKATIPYKTYKLNHGTHRIGLRGFQRGKIKRIFSLAQQNFPLREPRQGDSWSFQHFYLHIYPAQDIGNYAGSADILIAISNYTYETPPSYKKIAKQHFDFYARRARRFGLTAVLDPEISPLNRLIQRRARLNNPIHF